MLLDEKMVKQLSSLAVVLCQPIGCQSLDVKKFHNRCHQDMCFLRTCPDPLSVYKAFKVTGMYKRLCTSG